jgi:hypothetical protein
MVEYFRNGGFNMWLLLAILVGTAAVGAMRDKERRPLVFLSGTVLALISGLFGMATGMVAVSKGYSRFPDPTAAIAEGLSELSNNGTFGAAIALVLGALALVTLRASKAAPRAA